MRVTAGVLAFALFGSAHPAAAQTPPAVAPDAAAAETAPLPTAEPGDPYERFNRAIWGINQGVDKVVIKPVSSVYRTVTPRPARRGVSKVFANLTEPWSAINNLLQGKVGRAFNNLGRFVVNTTIGVGGLADHATELGLKPTPEDFGQTLAAWGVKSSAYLVLPLFGPSTVRDGVGTGVGFVANPYPICLRVCTNLSGTERLGIQATQVVSIRSDLTESGADAFLDSSLDPYATARSAYLQNRAAAIADSEAATDDGATDDAPANLDPNTADTPPAESSPAADGAPPPAETPAAETPPTLSFIPGNLEG